MSIPSGCTNFRLRQFMRVVGQHYDAHLARAGLKTTQYSLLSHIQAMGPVRPSDLAHAMRMDTSTLTRNLKPLLAAGWVSLSPGADGRSRLVDITDVGRAKRAEAKACWREAQEGLNARLGVERVAALHELIDGSIAALADEPVENAHERRA